MLRKSPKEKALDAKYKEDYDADVQELLDLIEESTVLKQTEPFEYEGKVLYKTVKYTIGGSRVIYSDLREVRSIEADDEEVTQLHLKVKDYKKVARACDARRKFLLAQVKANSK